MRELTVPPLAVASDGGTLGDLVFDNAAADPQAVGYSYRDHGGEWREVTHAEFADDVARLASGLMRHGVAVGDRVVLMSSTRFEWTLFDVALLSIGAVVVPVFPTSSPNHLDYILADVQPTLLIAENDAIARRILGPQETPVLIIDNDAIGQLRDAGAQVSRADLDLRRASVDRGAVATIVYTSGTTGQPKGCPLTHANFIDLIDNSYERMQAIVTDDDRATVILLPLAHVFARYVQFMAIYTRSRLGHSRGSGPVLEDVAAFQPTFLLAVPRVFERMFKSMQLRAVLSGEGRAFDHAVQHAIARSQALDLPDRARRLPGPRSRRYRWISEDLRAALGGRIRYCLSGGAPLSDDLAHFFRGVGLPILQGWGLSESTAPVTVNTPERTKIGTVGMPLPGTGVRIDDNGVVEVRGVGVFGGYLNNEASTRAAFDGPWLRTGDLGELDDDGFLRITGRAKDLLVTADGTNVAPGPIEDRLRMHPLVSEVIVVGEGRPFPAALITLDADLLAAWAQVMGKPGLTMTQAATDPAVLASLQNAVDETNDALSDSAMIRRFRVVSTDFEIERDEMTPSFKLRREQINAGHASVLDEIYSPS